MDQRQHFVSHRLEITKAGAEGGPQLLHRLEQPIVRSPPPQHPPEPLNKIALRAVTGQTIQLQLGMRREHLCDPCGLLPGRVIDRAQHGGAQCGRLRPCQIPSMPRKGLLQPCGLRESGLAAGLGGPVDQAGRQLSRHHLHRRKAIDQIFVVPGPHDRPRAVDAERGVERGDPWEAGFIWAHHDTLASWGLFFSSANSALVAAWRWGSPRRSRYVGREGPI